MLRLPRDGDTAKRLRQEVTHQRDEAEVAQLLQHFRGAVVLQCLPDFIDDHLGEMAPGAAELLAKRIHPDGTAGERRGPRGQGALFADAAEGGFRRPHLRVDRCGSRLGRPGVGQEAVPCGCIGGGEGKGLPFGADGGLVPGQRSVRLPDRPLLAYTAPGSAPRPSGRSLLGESFAGRPCSRLAWCARSLIAPLPSRRRRSLLHAP